MIGSISFFLVHYCQVSCFWNSQYGYASWPWVTFNWCTRSSYFTLNQLYTVQLHNVVVTRKQMTPNFPKTEHFFSIWVFFHDHLRTTGLQGKREGISLTPHYHFHPLHRHLDINWVIATESSRLHIGSSRTRTGNLWFRAQVAYH